MTATMRTITATYNVNDCRNVDFDGQSMTFTYIYDLRREITKQWSIANGPHCSKRLNVQPNV